MTKVLIRCPSEQKIRKAGKVTETFPAAFSLYINRDIIPLAVPDDFNRVSARLRAFFRNSYAQNFRKLPPAAVGSLAMSFNRVLAASLGGIPPVLHHTF